MKSSFLLLFFPLLLLFLLTTWASASRSISLSLSAARAASIRARTSIGSALLVCVEGGRWPLVFADVLLLGAGILRRIVDTTTPPLGLPPDLLPLPLVLLVGFLAGFVLDDEDEEEEDEDDLKKSMDGSNTSKRMQSIGVEMVEMLLVARESCLLRMIPID